MTLLLQEVILAALDLYMDKRARAQSQQAYPKGSPDTVFYLRWYPDSELMAHMCLERLQGYCRHLLGFRFLNRHLSERRIANQYS